MWLELLIHSTLSFSPKRIFILCHVAFKRCNRWTFLAFIWPVSQYVSLLLCLLIILGWILLCAFYLRELKQELGSLVTVFLHKCGFTHVMCQVFTLWGYLKGAIDESVRRDTRAGLKGNHALSEDGRQQEERLVMHVMAVLPSIVCLNLDVELTYLFCSFKPLLLSLFTSFGWYMRGWRFGFFDCLLFFQCLLLSIPLACLKAILQHMYLLFQHFCRHVNPILLSLCFKYF